MDGRRGLAAFSTTMCMVVSPVVARAVRRGLGAGTPCERPSIGRSARSRAGRARCAERYRRVFVGRYGRAGSAVVINSRTLATLCAHRREHRVHRDRFVAVDAGVVVGDQGDRGIRDVRFGGEHGFGIPRHVHDVPAHLAEPQALGAGGEPWAVDHHHGAAVVHRAPVERAGRVEQDRPQRGAYGSANVWWCTAPSDPGRPSPEPTSWNVSGRSLVRSTI